jgi:cell division protein FtsI/penicillin-binding protein 2
MRKFFCIILVIVGGCSTKQNTLEKILRNSSASFRDVLNNPKYEVQIIYGEMTDAGILHHHYRVDSSRFFYPASTVKMLVAFAAMERLTKDSLSLKAHIQIDSQRYHPIALKYDSLFESPITIENLIKKIFVVSDNEAYNLLYRWLGKDYINQVHKRKGMDTRVIHLLNEKAFSFPQEANNFSYSTTLMDSLRVKKYTGVSQHWESDLLLKNQTKGRGYIDSLGNLVKRPFDFSTKNYVSLPDLLGALERAIKPEYFSESERYHWDKKTRNNLLTIMAMKPSDLPFPLDTLPDNYVKFLMYGDADDAIIPDHIEIRNKVGWAYGYLTDVAHVMDKKNKIEYFLAATIHVNSNEIYNDGVYEYEKVGLPFLGELGRRVYQYEINKKDARK